MSYFNNKAQQQTSNTKQIQKTKPTTPQSKKVLEKDQQQIDKEQGKTLSFTNDEVVFIENVLVKLEGMIPNEQGENSEILEMIVLAEQIIGSRLDQDSGLIGDSA